MVSGRVSRRDCLKGGEPMPIAAGDRGGDAGPVGSGNGIAVGDAPPLPAQRTSPRWCVGLRVRRGKRQVDLAGP
jgi:hypothetical protein